MIRKALKPITRSFFFNKNKEPTVVSPTSVKPKNKAYLTQAIIENNKQKGKLLPPSNDPSKLTVVLEMD